MGIQPNDIRAFFDSCFRADNDAANKTRESVLEALLEPASCDAVDAMKADASHGADWARVGAALALALRALTIREPELHGSSFSGGTRKSGRGHNYDFNLTFVGPDGTAHAKMIELKQGKSIHNQPQFLSLTASRGNVTREDVVSYREYFFDGYMASLRRLTTELPPDRDTYLRLVGSVDYECHPFFLAQYNDDKRGGSPEAEERSEIADRSAHQYLSMLVEKGREAIDWPALNRKLAAQVEKRFLSWHAKSCAFAIESYSADDMRLSGTVRADAGRGGLYRYLVLPTDSGCELACMLRWRNHKAILNPAWQIRLKRGRARPR